MVNWFRDKNPVTGNHRISFKSGSLSKWANKLKNINKNKRKKQPITTVPHRRTTTTTTTPTLPSILSTRGHFSLLTGKLIFLHNASDCDYHRRSTLSRNYYLGGGELVMYIHGVWVDHYSAKEQVDRINLSLGANGCHIPLMGFSWDSNTSVNPIGWGIAKSIASQNGLKLAKFISDFKTVYQDVNIRIIAHSLGAKIVESALIALDENNNKRTQNKHIPYYIASIHLMGAAINDMSTSKNTPFGNAIENTVNRFYNLYNPEDNALKRVYVNTENQNPLGLHGIKKGEHSPANYAERNVKFEIPPLKRASGLYQSFCDKAVYGWGDNHCGYIGFREPYPFNRFLKDDGAINVIVDDWRREYDIR
jgi:Alpha/beta hydrolase of unknown function (DUF900)